MRNWALFFSFCFFLGEGGLLCFYVPEGLVG